MKFSTRRAIFLLSVGVIFSDLVLLAAWWVFAPYRHLDLLIMHGTVVDGSGAEPRVCNIGVRDGRIVELSPWRFYFSQARTTIDARGKIVAPGFIDVHTHVEPNLPAAGAFQPANFLRQGVTTIITGNCGRSRTDIAAVFNALEKHKSYINVATLIGHNSVRQEVMDTASRRPTTGELNRMKQLVERAMSGGALGLSTGLVYAPGRFAEQAEVVALSEVAARNSGLYVSHIRDEGRGGMEAISEALEVGRLSGAPIHISHFKSSGRSEWHSMSKRLELLDAARSAGQSVTIDVYPYNRSSTTTDVLLPGWAVKDGRAGLRQAGKNPQIRQQLHADILAGLREEGWNDLTHVRLAAGRPEWVGHTLADVPVASPDIGRQIENLIDISLLGGAQAIYADMDEDDVAQVIDYPYCVFGSDSAVRDPDILYKPHPRGCGTFPRIFNNYVRGERSLGLSQAVYKASGQAAEIFKLGDRGKLRPGAWADIVIFDLEIIRDGADYDQPFAPPHGIDYVIVNGVIAVDHGNLSGNRPAGMAVKRQ
ncbi:MAG: amidohydrolase family protein [Acidobacteria bacterium]|nr:amidohydrolase family protein [Acidobacteriota bacterium]